MQDRKPHLLFMPGLSAENLVAQLAIPHRHKYTLRRLMACGASAAEALRNGLRHEDPNVRVGCCKVLDHHMDETALPELIANLDHPVAAVRIWAIHALACDRCKEGACRPGEDEVIPRAARMLRYDTSRKAREMAAGMLGPSVHRSADALDAIRYAFHNDPDPVVRKIASWWVPGGTRYEKMKPVV